MVIEYGKMDDFLPTNNFYMTGISGYKVKQGYGEFNISININKQSVLEVTTNEAFE